MNLQPEIMRKLGQLSEEQREQKLALFLQLEPLLLKCLSLNHDINNPLTGILGYGEFLLEESDNLPEESTSHIRKIIECASRIKEMIDELCEVKIGVSEKIDLKVLAKQYESSPSASDEMV